jgi:hypothetical protein
MRTSETPRSPRGNRVGHFRSSSEARLASLLESAGVPYTYEKRVVTYVRPARQSRYIADFALENGIILEVKGWWRPADRQKTMLILKSNPGLDLRMVFDTPHRPINKGSKTTYAGFCEKHGIPWSGPDIPKEWLHEQQAAA